MTTFTVQSDWAVLVLEDTPERIAWFKQRLPQAVYCATANAAIEALKTHEFRAVFLDHDLHWTHATSGNRIIEGSGGEVALHLKNTEFSGIIVIHSRNEEGAGVMKRLLPHAKRARFGEFEIEVER